MNEDPSVNLKLVDGSLVGHLGGTSGRPLRKSSNASAPSSQSNQLKLSGNENPSSKEEILQYVTSQISNLESTANQMIDTIFELKAMMEKLQNCS